MPTLGNLLYVSQKWVEENSPLIFPTEHPSNMRAAVAGLAFAPAAALIDKLLLESNVFDWAFHNEIIDKHARENLIQRIALAYLWGSDQLTSPRLKYLFDQNMREDINTIVAYFWAARSKSREQRERILQFWDHCIAWAGKFSEAPATTLSGLSRLAVCIDTLGEFEERLLSAVASYVLEDFNAVQFIENLNRLADVSPVRISNIVGRMLDAYEPLYDYEGQLAGLFRKLLGNSETRLDALRLVNRVRLPEMTALYREFTTTS